jgi:hypothetical protein
MDKIYEFDELEMMKSMALKPLRIKIQNAY